MAGPSSLRTETLFTSGLIAMVVVALSACGPNVPDGQELSEKFRFAGKAGADAPLELSLDTASFADLSQPAVNEEFGIHAFFPEGSVVCQARSGDHPVGFGTDLDRNSDCDNPRGDRLVRIVGVQASYNTGMRTSAEGQLPCAPGTAPPYMGLDFRQFVFQDLGSISCMTRDKEGQILVGVAALGGGVLQNEPPDPPTTRQILYWSILGTDAGHLREDLALYREFLRRLRIVPVE